MYPLPASTLLAVWEQGTAQTTPERALALLAAAFPGTSVESLARLPVGRRDACLLALREQTFGPHLESHVPCPACGESLEIEFTVGDVRVPLPDPSGPVPDAPGGAPAEGSQDPELWLEMADYQVHYRLPNSLDLVALARHSALDADRLRQMLLERCVLSARRRQKRTRPVAVSDLPDDVTHALAEQMALADPQANVRLALSCPSCGHAWPARFDILPFFWQEIEAWAGRVLRDVHTLAWAYGWREADILALSPTRRKIYLDLIHEGQGRRL